MRQKISELFGFHLSNEESLIAYISRMDKIGQIDQFKTIKIFVILAEEIEKMNLEIESLKKLKSISK